MRTENLCLVTITLTTVSLVFLDFTLNPCWTSSGVVVVPLLCRSTLSAARAEVGWERVFAGFQQTATESTSLSELKNIHLHVIKLFLDWSCFQMAGANGGRGKRAEVEFKTAPQLPDLPKDLLPSCWFHRLCPCNQQKEVILTLLFDLSLSTPSLDALTNHC